MAIKQYDKIVAQEINNSASTSFNQGAFIYANDIASLYGGIDNIAKGVLIRAEHFQNLGLPGSGGLNGTFNGVPFKNAIADSSSGLEYVQDSNGWTLYITKGGTIKFTNFGRYGNNTDIFMIGGGGAGNKDGGNGGGGQPITESSIGLSTNTSYTLTIGAGAISSGGNGGETYTTIFDKRASGGEGGISGGKYAETWYAESSSGNFDYVTHDEADSWEDYDYSEGEIIIAEPREYIDLPNIPGNIGTGLAGYLYDDNGRGKIYWCAPYTQLLEKLNDLYKNGSNGSKWTNLTYCFNDASSLQVGGLGPDPSSASTAGQAGTRYGQGGGGNYNKAYGGSVFGAGKSGIIAIRNHR